MSKSHLRPSAPIPADEAIQQEALAVARSVQRPGQTKEQTRLIAQGIAKGIEQYKRQQGAKSRERDKARKRALKQRIAESLTYGAGETLDSDLTTGRNHALPLRISGGLFGFFAAFHLARVLVGWPLILGNWTVPSWLSLAVAVPLAGLAIWLFRSTT